MLTQIRPDITGEVANGIVYKVEGSNRGSSPLGLVTPCRLSGS
jgi:hypothetical protein